MSSFVSSNGHITMDIKSVVKNKTACAYASYFQSSSEYSRTYYWYVLFGSRFFGYYHKGNSDTVRPVVALGEDTIEGWIEARDDCYRHKLSSPQCDTWRATHGEEDLRSLMQEVYTRTYEPSKSICFVVSRPKLREIFAADFRDRIVQHWVCLRLNPLFEQHFNAAGNVSFNCRKGYGVDKAIERIVYNTKKVSHEYTEDAYYLKIDIKSFFMSVDGEIMWRQIHSLIEEEYHGEDKDTLLYLTEKIVRHRPQKHCERKGRLYLWDELPEGKSLFDIHEWRGMPIGNITSQLFANYHLCKFDEWSVEVCSENGATYQRFVDDILIVSKDKEFALRYMREASAKLNQELKLRLHPNKVYLQHVSKGVKMLGRVVKPNRVYSAGTVMGGLSDAFAEVDMECEGAVKGRGDMRKLSYMCDSINSYLGFLSHTQSYAIRRRWFARMEWFWKVFTARGDFLAVSLRKKYEYSRLLTKKENQIWNGLLEWKLPT